MTYRDWFESIRAKVLDLMRMEADLEDLRAKSGPRGQSFEVVSLGSSSGDAADAVLRLVQAELEYDKAKAECDGMVSDALAVLYGQDGRGGLAKAKTSTDADCICGYYLMGMRWREVAEDMARPDSADPRHWCMMRAHRAFEYMDKFGLAPSVNLAHNH